jgi:glycosyltransferase involved in cell wall biosynthesis
MAGCDDGITNERGCCLKAEDYIRQRFADPGTRRHVEWLGLRSASEILALRRESFLSIVASRYESFSMTALEAMASACPLVAPNIGGPAEIVQHERNGLLFRPGDPVDLADKILQLMNHPELATYLGRQAVSCALDRYHPITVARQMLEYYDSVLDRTRRTPQYRRSTP